MAEIDNIPEMRPSFDNIRRQDEGGNEYWSSRDLCAAMGYSVYWKFQRVIDKAIKVAGEKGMNVDDHFNQAVDMVRIGSGSFRKVNIFRLSRMACMIVAENANVKKVLVQQARDYFTRTLSINELMQNSLSSNILLYKTAQGEARIEVIFNSETFWMSQKRMADLFGVDVRTVNYHLGQIYETGELTKEATIRKIGIVQTEGDREVERMPLFYNLDAIVAVGYRVNSYQATQFRIWATSVLKEFIIKGYAGAYKHTPDSPITGIRQIHAYTSHFLERYNERFLKNPTLSSNEIALRYLSRNKTMMPLQQNSEINRNHEQYGVTGQYAFRVRDGICFAQSLVSGIKSEDGDRHKDKVDAMLILFTTFMVESKMSDIQRAAIEKSTAKNGYNSVWILTNKPKMV